MRATILLMGDSGLRREEAASARRENLKASVYGTLERPVWELTIVGKGQRERTVPVSAATLEALRAHWADRGRDFDERRNRERRGCWPGRCLAPSSFRGPTHHVVGIGRNVATLSKSKRPATQRMD